MARRYVNSVDDLAAAVGCSARIVYSWRSRFASEFPAKVDGKGYDVGATKKFIDKHGLKVGSSRSHANGDGTGGTVTEARRLLYLSQREVSELERQRRERELALGMGQVLLAEDVAADFERVVNTAKTVLASFIDRREQDIRAAKLPADLEERLLLSDQRMLVQFSVTMESLTTDDEDLPKEETIDA